MSAETQAMAPTETFPLFCGGVPTNLPLCKGSVIQGLLSIYGAHRVLCSGSLKYYSLMGKIRYTQSGLLAPASSP